METLPDKLEDIEHHFKITAGPGAGKTFWLINHIINVLRNSKRLGKTSKIACITYTNTAVEEITSRLAASSNKVEVSTIHSFLYSNILKPFIFLLAREDGKCILNLRNLEGHDDHIPNNGKIYTWKKETNQTYLRNDKKVVECLKNLLWKLEENEIKLSTKDIWGLKVDDYSIRKDSLVAYKQLYWNEGQIHHDDVLYFSYRLIHEYPAILKFICAKFPYLFIDEFQDTSPIQTSIAKRIAETGTVTGVIGDPWQSIFEFQGARKQDFINFSLLGMKNYKIEDNRRSSNQIVRLLEKIRPDLPQKCKRKNSNGNLFEGNSVKLIVGDKFVAINEIKSKHNLAVLARTNKTINAVRYGIAFEGADNLIKKFNNVDNDYKRRNFILSSIKALEFARQDNYKESVTEIIKNVRRFVKTENDKEIRKKVIDNDRQKIAINLIKIFKTKYSELLSMTLYDYYNELKSIISSINIYTPEGFRFDSLSSVRAGKFKTFADETIVKELLEWINLSDEKSPTRTFHKAKGAEFDNVLVLFENEKDLDFFLEPSDEDEDHRAHYVAISRARDNLFLNVPEIFDDKRFLKIQNLGIDIAVLPA